MTTVYKLYKKVTFVLSDVIFALFSLTTLFRRWYSERGNVLTHPSCVSFAIWKKRKKSTWCQRQLSYLFLTATHLPCCLHFLKPCSASDAQPAVHCSQTLDSISGLAELCVCKVSIAPLSAFHDTDAALQLIISHRQDHSVVSGWNCVNWGVVDTSQEAGWEVLQTRPRDCARQQFSVSRHQRTFDPVRCGSLTLPSVACGKTPKAIYWDRMRAIRDLWSRSIWVCDTSDKRSSRKLFFSFFFF